MAGREKSRSAQTHGNLLILWISQVVLHGHLLGNELFLFFCGLFFYLISTFFYSLQASLEYTDCVMQEARVKKPNAEIFQMYPEVRWYLCLFAGRGQQGRTKSIC